MGTQSMSASEREEFLAGVHVGVLAIERTDGPPLAVPVWYGYEPGGLVEVLTSAASLKGRLVTAAGRAFTGNYDFATLAAQVVELTEDRLALLRDRALRERLAATRRHQTAIAAPPTELGGSTSRAAALRARLEAVKNKQQDPMM